MSNGDEHDETEAPDENAADEEPAAAEEEPAAEEAEEEPAADETEDLPASTDVDELESRLDEAEAAIEDAETEADLDEVEATLDGIAADLQTDDLPEPEDEDEEGPHAELESRLESVRDGLEAARGPYAEDVVADIETAIETATTTEWTETGREEVAAATRAFVETLNETLDTSVEPEGKASTVLEAAAEAVSDAGLDPDEDAETLATLVEATDALAADLDDAEEWDDLSVREQMTAEGFYDRLTSENRKDFPPELGVVRIAEAENDPERLLMALDYFESNFMEENVLDALRRLAPEEAVEPMLERAEKRDQPAIRVLGKIGDERAVDTLVEFVESEGNAPLEKVTLRALGEIGSQEATQAVADRLVADDPGVRSHAARALGRIGDTRAIDPLADVLAADEDDPVRAAAAWALNRIGTERALAAAAEYADDRAYTVQAEAEKARDATADTGTA